MLLLDVNKISKNFGYNYLFKDVSFSLNEGESIAIIGPNGCGKSTILKLIMGLESTDTGSISIKKGAKIGYLDQGAVNIDNDKTVYEVLKDAFSEINELERQIKIYEKKIGENYKEKELEKYCALIEKFNLLGGYEIESRISTVTNGLKLDKNIKKELYKNLSGGEKTIVQLAKILLLKPDLLILDEPTNHLDINRIEWLEEYIKSFKGASVIVSHDRYFLDKMVNKVLTIDDDGIGRVYATNYSGYLKLSEEMYQKRLAQYGDEQESIKQLELKAKQFMQAGMAKNSSSLTRQGKNLWERAQKMRAEAIKKPLEQKKINMSFNEKRKSSNRIIVTDKLSVFTPENVKILDNINLEIIAGDKVAIIGENGSGKSTFVKAIMGDQNLESSGSIYVGPSVKIGYIPQVIEFEDENKTLYEYFSRRVGLSEEKSRSILSRFKFKGDTINKKLKNLSGGERMRLKLAELLQQEVNTLIFDEPTNHIDIPTKEVFEEALDDFGGTLIFVSHDRFFINKYANKVIVFEDGKIKEYIGNYDSYKETIAKTDEQEGKKLYKKTKKY